MRSLLVPLWSRFLVVFGVALALGAAAGATEPRDLQTEVRELREQVDQLEKRNAETSASKFDVLDGVTVDVSFTTVGQRANGPATVGGRRESQLNYRADIAASLPVGSIGDGEGKLSALVRLGQGEGLVRLKPTFSGSNATAFQLSGSSLADDSTALLAELWYQATMPIKDAAGESRSEWQIGFGKTEVFLFFDQNAVAGDEAHQFLNNAFVHNPLLDAGGDVGADVYGFQPGVRVAYFSQTHKPVSYGLSVGVFGAGAGAHYENTFSSPFSIVQAETHQRVFGGLDGNYRLYFWRNGQAAPYNNAFDISVEEHVGWGFSIDQRISERVILFARYGRQTKGRVQFDRTMTAGAEIGGELWGRALDAVGAAAGILRTSAEFRADAPTLDANGDGTADFGYAPDASEKVYEFYYRYHVSKEFALTPDFQVVQNPGGNGAAESMKIIGLRAQVTF